MSELEEVVDGADHRPLGSDLIKASQQELPKASDVLDLPEHGFDHLLPEPIAASAAGSLQPLSHGAHQRHLGQLATARGMRLPMTRSPWRQVALDPALLQGGEAQFEALELLSGRARPELGGRPDYIDIVGVNYYLHNQWVDADLPISVDHPQYRPLRHLLADVYNRYERPLFVAETGIEGDLRPAWLRIIGHEVKATREAGVPVEGLCIYPVTDYPGWEDERHCSTGLLGHADAQGHRSVYSPLAQELFLQQEDVPAAR